MAAITSLTYILNLLALAWTIWLSFYIITTSPRRIISWLTTLALWSISGIFLNMLLAITPPLPPETLETWQVVLFPFWSSQVFNTGVSGWLSGWLATPAIAFWHHITVILREEKPSPLFKLQIFVVYLLAAVTIYAQLNTSLMFSEAAGDPLKLNYLKPGIFYVIFMSLLIVISAVCAYNLVIAAKTTPSNFIRKQMLTLFIATCMAGLTGPISLIALSDQVTIPRVINTILLFSTVILIGVSISRYSALIEGRLIRRDFIYNASIVSTIMLIYLAVTWVAVKFFHVPESAYIVVIILAVISHTLVDITRRYMDKKLIHKDEHALKSELYKLTRTNSGQMGAVLENMLFSLCSAVRATYGLILAFVPEMDLSWVTFNWGHQEADFHPDDFLADDLLLLEPNHFAAPLGDAALLVPLYEEKGQIGAIILGHPVNGLQYPQNDQELILECSDLIAEVISNHYAAEMQIISAAEMINTIKSPAEVSSLVITPKMIESLLRNVLDYAYLGKSDFARQQIVNSRLSDDHITHIDKGKIVYEIIAEVVEKLRPQYESVRSPPPREWHPYLILQWAYFEDRLNREIMAELYISEGTFNRTRRSALRSITRALQEMQQASL